MRVISKQPNATILLIVSMLATFASVPGNTEPTFMGSEACVACHREEAADWRESHHDLAMQEATPETVLGDFNDATFTYAGTTSRFYRQGGTFWVRTDNGEGELQDFPVSYVFGVYPLQQLLLPLSGGRLQALSIAWDARPQELGGQRWYHLYADSEQPILAGDPLHWTGPYQNWNTRCAECHSTNVKKNYQAATKQFDTQWDEIDVGCEACHGPGSKHLKLAAEGRLDSAQFAGFAMSLAARGQWQWAEDATIAHRVTPLTDNTQIDNCGRCHARRGTLGDYHYGAQLLDTHRVATVNPPLYWPDGQIREEVYVYGSFVQSKMHQAGVVCSNCHNPHSNALRAEGNAVCGQCHKPASYDNASHHRHPVGSTGAQCVECHMPEQVYMGVDGRRDHSMRIPRPDLSLTTNSPNACIQCHENRSNIWAMETLEHWGIRFDDRNSHPARGFHSAQRGDIRALPSLKTLMEDPDQPAILRASAINAYSQFGPPDLPRTAAMLLSSRDALLRLEAARAAAAIDPRQRYLLLRPLIADPVLAVRMEVAQQLAEVPMAELRPQDRQKLEPLFAEYEAVQSQHLDMPATQLQLANYWLARGDAERAESALREALAINPQLEAGIINLADLLARHQREREARQLLEHAIAKHPSPGVLHHSLGLLEIRSGNTAAALVHLKTAAELEDLSSRHRYVYAIALHDTGEPVAAIAVLERLNTELPGNPDVLSALIGYSRELGDTTKSRHYQSQLESIVRSAGLR